MLTAIPYASLNARQKENYNFHKLAAVLADYGYHAIPLSDDWNGADLIAVHINGLDVLRVQLKGRFTIAKKYVGKELHVAFRHPERGWCLYPHDEVTEAVLAESNIGETVSWAERGMYSFPTPSKAQLALLEPHFISAAL